MERSAASPASSEDLVRASPKRPPATLTAPPDGQTLEGVIGELQSTYGVPQYPQEFRITIKVAEEKESRGDRGAASDGEPQQGGDGDGGAGTPRREKAPAAPRIAAEGGEETPAPEGRSRRRRGRRRRRGGGSGGAAPGS